jgi:ferredoxin
MRPLVDHDLCIGCGVCEDTCPEVFELGTDGLSHVIDESPPESLRDRVLEAEDLCPVAAITVEE